MPYWSVSFPPVHLQRPAPTEASQAEPTEAVAAATEAPTEASAEPTVAAKVFKVAVVFPGSIKDAGWNQSGYEAAMAAKDKYGVEVSFQESVPNAELKDVLRNYAAEGYDLIIGHDYNFTDPIIEVAPEFPDTMFGISGGYMVEGDNVVVVAGTNWESTYLAGVLAGLMTKSNKIGILMATDSPTAKKMYNGFQNGAKVNNPDVKALLAYSGSWDDVVKGKEMVRSMIEQGADIIYTQSGQVNVGAVEAAKEGRCARHWWSCGYVGSRSRHRDQQRPCLSGLLCRQLDQDVG